MTITNSNSNDIPEIFRLYQLATDFQVIKFPSNKWPVFDQELIKVEIDESRQFKLSIDDTIVCIWAIAFSDEQIWEDSKNDAAIYIHRIATNPEFRGNNFIQRIVDWAKDYASKQNIDFIRMDTCGENLRLINHYSSCGFKYLGMKKIKNFSELPSHYHNADVCYFELALN